MEVIDDNSDILGVAVIGASLVFLQKTIGHAIILNGKSSNMQRGW